MKPRAIVGPLLPPNTPPDLPYGLERGGIFDADYVPPTYIDARRATVPTDSPVSHNVSQDLFRRPVTFANPNQPRRITGGEGAYAHRGVGQLPTVVMGRRPMGQLPTVVYDPAYRGFGKTYRTSYDAGHDHTVTIPNRGMGRFIQGMGPQPGYIMERVGMPPIPIRSWAPVQVPHGTTEGGIFGRQRYINGQSLPYVPQMVQRDIVVERTSRPLGAGPDGLGG